MAIKKHTLIAFILFDVLLVAIFIGAAIQRASIGDNPQVELRDLGVALIPERPPVAEFRLTDHEGNSFTNQSLLNHWNILFFGFTSCPDVCPLTMNALKLFYNDMDNSDYSDDTRVIMVSVDPQRDSIEAMAEYVASFHEDFIGLTGDSSVIENLASELYIAFSEPPAHDEHSITDDYIIRHSGYIAIIGPGGIYRGVIRAPHTPDSIRKAYAAIRDR